MTKRNALMVPQELDMDAARDHARSLMGMGASKKDAARIAVCTQLGRRNSADWAAFDQARRDIAADTARRRAAGENI